jgi:alpha-N-arabinofuranosidase
MRDALVAAASSTFLTSTAAASLGQPAQTVNVLQSFILTEGDQMVMTPTYHVFDLYNPSGRSAA